MTQAVQHGVPGEWARVKGTVLSLWPLFVCFTALGAFLSAAILGSHVAVFAGLLTASLAATAVMWRKGLRRVESFFLGARGEERVARTLAQLPEGYHIFNDFGAGHYHVDHVVAGPTGLFAVETKNWRGHVTVEEGHILIDGSLPSRPPVAQAVHQADAVKAVLTRRGWNGSVTPVVCFASETFVPGRASIGAVSILNISLLVPWIASLPVVLPTNELARLTRLLETRV